MAEENVFIGMGVNPETGVPDIPLGFGAALSQDNEAMSYFGTLTKEQKAGVVRFLQGGSTGGDARRRLESAVKNLKRHNISFI